MPRASVALGLDPVEHGRRVRVTFMLSRISFFALNHSPTDRNKWRLLKTFLSPFFMFALGSEPH